MKRLLMILFMLALITGCKDEEITQPENENKLLGKWSETYEWKSVNDINILPEDNGSGESKDNERTSTIIFDEDGYTLRVDPPVAYIKIENNKEITTYSDDTLYTGKYEIKGDIVKLFHGESKKEFWFGFNEQGDSLRLIMNEDYISVDVIDTVCFVTMSSFIWGNSIGKYDGRFAKE